MTNIDIAIIVFSIFFSSVGLAYFLYGKQQGLYYRLCGVLLFIYPYFVNSLLEMLITGIGLMALPFIFNHLLPLE